VSGRRSISLAIALALAVPALACGSPAPSPSPAESLPSAEPIEAHAGGPDGFELILRADKQAYAVDEPMTVGATLVYRGPRDSIDGFGSGSGPIMFTLEQLDGPIDTGGAMNSDCARHTFVRDEVVSRPFQKSGGFSDDDPLAGFWRAFYADPQLRLPAGTWRITAATAFDLGDCGGQPVRHSASIVVVTR
jgi:hypothetical protein